MALWGEPNELSIQYRIYIFIQYVDSLLVKVLNNVAITLKRLSII